MFHRWLVVLALCVAIVVVSAIGSDYAIADALNRLTALHKFLAQGLFRLPMLQAAGVVLFAGGLIFSDRAVASSAFWRIALQAGLAMVLVVLLNSFLLKPIFGRAVPWLYLAHGQYGFHPLHASKLFGSFPSGHAALATALATVVWMSYPRLRPFCCLSLVGLGLALLVGEFHYFSDLVAGGFVGATLALVSIQAIDVLIARERLGLAGRHFLDLDVARLWQQVREGNISPPEEGYRTKSLDTNRN